MQARHAPPQRPPRRGSELVRELFTVCVAASTYFAVRVLVEGGVAESTSNARRIIDVESGLGIDIERQTQEAVLGHRLLRAVGNFSYVWLHWPLLIVVLVVLFRRQRVLYLRLRNAMFMSGTVGLALFALFPTAPPRFMPGFTGTVGDDARRHYLAIPLSWANQYASFPSFHVGWTLIACIAVATAITRRHHSALAMVPAGLVGMSVVSTGNHFVLDAAVGATIALAAYAWFGRPAAVSAHAEPQIEPVRAAGSIEEPVPFAAPCR